MTVDARREEQLRIQALGAALSRREWWEVEQAYNRIRDEFDRRPTDARLEAAEAALAKAVKALKEIEDHPENSSGTSRSYGIGWAFWNVQNIARRARAAAPETEGCEWPAGCPKQRSCSRYRGCMYGCKAHAGRPPEAVRSEIDAAIRSGEKDKP